MPAAARGRAAGKSDKPWRDAIRRAVLRSQKGEKDKNLEKLADQLVTEGLLGDVAALREIGDRLDGKSAQSHTGEDGGAIEVTARLIWAGKSSEKS